MPRIKSFEEGISICGLEECIVTVSNGAIFLHNESLEDLDVFSLGNGTEIKYYHYFRTTNSTYPSNCIEPTFVGDKAYFRFQDSDEETCCITEACLKKDGSKQLRVCRVPNFDSNTIVGYSPDAIYYTGMTEEDVLDLYKSPLHPKVDQQKKELISDLGVTLFTSYIQNHSIIFCDYVASDFDGKLVPMDENYMLSDAIPASNCCVTMYSIQHLGSYLYDGKRMEPVSVLVTNYLEQCVNTYSSLKCFSILVYRPGYRLYALSFKAHTCIVEVTNDDMKCLALIQGKGYIIFRTRPEVDFSVGFDLRHQFKNEVPLFYSRFYSSARIVRVDNNMLAVLDITEIEKCGRNFRFGYPTSVIVDQDEQRIYLKGSNDSNWNDFVNKKFGTIFCAESNSTGSSNRITIKKTDVAAEWVFEDHDYEETTNTDVFCYQTSDNHGMCVFIRDKRYEIPFAFDGKSITVEETRVFNEYHIGNLFSNNFDRNLYVYEICDIDEDDNAYYVRDVIADTSKQLELSNTEEFIGWCSHRGFFTTFGIYELHNDLSASIIRSYDFDISACHNAPGDNVIEVVTCENREITVRSLSVQGAEEEIKIDILIDILSVYEAKVIE
ncbi:hypothetical protein PCE1_003469 [Barthelona sp. PCE]